MRRTKLYYITEVSNVFKGLQYYDYGHYSLCSYSRSGCGERLPVFDMGGYLSTEVKEAKERVRIALRNSGYEQKPRRITVNISPADIHKYGTGFDLPIAIGILGAQDEVNMTAFEDMVIIGELSLMARSTR